MTAHMTAVEAAGRLGIAPADRDVFVLLVDRLRTAPAHEAELARLRAELAAVNEALHKAGIDYPTGAAGVRDLNSLFRGALEACDEARDELREARR